MMYTQLFYFPNKANIFSYEMKNTKTGFELVCEKSNALSINYKNISYYLWRWIGI